MIAVWTLIGMLALAGVFWLGGLLLDSESFAHWMEGLGK